MNDALPRPVLVVGTPIVIGLFALALWAWMKFGAGVWFDAISTGFSACL